MIDEPTILAAVLMIALVIYALTGGADFGGGVWELFSYGPRKAGQRQVIAGALAPIWEANNVWLVLVVVMLFVAFPRAFAVLSIALHIPLTLALLGIVFRGSSFTFRHYDPEGEADRRTRRWGLQFAVASVLTPIMLGVCVGTVVSGRAVTEQGAPGSFLHSWLHPFPACMGLFTLALFAYLAATYLTLETEDRGLQDDFRARALVAAGACCLLAFVGRTLAPRLLVPLELPISLEILTGLVGLGAVACLWQRRFWLARALAALQVVCVLWAWGVAQFPYLVPPALTFHGTAAPTAVLRMMIGALALGAFLLLPSFVYLYRVFKRR